MKRRLVKYKEKLLYLCENTFVASGIHNIVCYIWCNYNLLMKFNIYIYIYIYIYIGDE